MKGSKTICLSRSGFYFIMTIQIDRLKAQTICSCASNNYSWRSTGHPRATTSTYVRYVPRPARGPPRNSQRLHPLPCPITTGAQLLGAPSRKRAFERRSVLGKFLFTLSSFFPLFHSSERPHLLPIPITPDRLAVLPLLPRRRLRRLASPPSPAPSLFHSPKPSRKHGFRRG